MYSYKLNKCWISQTTAALSLENPGNVYVICYSNEHLSDGRDPHVKSVVNLVIISSYPPHNSEKWHNSRALIKLNKSLRFQ